MKKTAAKHTLDQAKFAERGLNNASRPEQPTRAPRRLAILGAALLVFLSAGYFQNSRPGWNANSQFALTCTIVERGTLRIDAYHQGVSDPALGRGKLALETNDKALYNGHYYCDKSPVTAFLGVPVFWVYNAVTRGLLNQPMSYSRALYWTTWWVEGLCAALLAALTAAFLMRRGVAPERALCAAALWILATPLLAYSILFFSYLPACAMMMGGVLCVEGLWSRPAEPTPRWKILLGGVLLGLASWTLNTMALVALVLTLGVALAPGTPGARTRRLAAWAIGGLLGVAGNFIYTRAVFGSWGSPYALEADPFFREQMARGLMGATRPRLLVAWLITLSPFQGLFLIFPLAAAALAGCVALLRRRGGARLEGALALAITGGLILYNSAYFMWWGGCGYAPRHLIPLLPLLAAGLVPWLASPRRWVGRALLVLGLVGALINLPAVAVNPQSPIHILNPATPGAFYDDPGVVLVTPEKVAEWPSPFAELYRVFWGLPYTDFNWGQALGLRGPASMLPLVALWGLAGWLIFRDRGIWRAEA